MVTEKQGQATVGETKVDVCKRLTLDLLGSIPGSWRSLEYIRDDFRESDGDVDEQALRAAINELIEESKIEWDERHWEDVYRVAPPHEGESLADKVKRLEAEVELLRARDAKLVADLKAVDAWTGDGDVETLDSLARRLWSLGVQADDVERLGAEYGARSLLQDIDRLEAEQAADRAATTALVESLPRCEARDGCGSTATGGVWDALGYEDDAHLCDAHRVDEFEELPHAAPLRALQALMTTWPREGDHGDREPLSDNIHRVDGLPKPARVEAGQWWRWDSGVGGEPFRVRDVTFDGTVYGRTTAGINRVCSSRLVLEDPSCWYLGNGEYPADPDAVEQDRERMRDVLRSASEKVAAWPEYLHSDNVKRRREEFARRCERLGADPPGYTADVVRFVETPDPDTGAPLYRVEDKAKKGDAFREMARRCGDPGTSMLAVSPRYIGEFGDIDEPSVGDVDGYGRRR